jgi:hypothetical protein
MSEKQSREVRFWPKVKKAGKDDCWLWFRVPKTFYPWFSWIPGKLAIPAHRAAWLLTHDKPPEGRLYICHRCGNRLCCNPNHLYAGTQKMNVADAIRQGTFKFPPIKRGGDVASSKLTDEKVEAIKAAFPHVLNKRALAMAFGINADYMKRIVLGESWKHLV